MLTHDGLLALFSTYISLFICVSEYFFFTTQISAYKKKLVAALYDRGVGVPAKK